MERVRSIALQQVPLGGTNGTASTNVSLAPERIGPVGEFLRNLGVPYPPVFGSIATFLVATVGLYLLTRSVVVPLFRRALAARGTQPHERRPLLRLTKAGLGFVAVTVAFGLAGYGNLFTSLAAISTAATLAVGIALQDTLTNLAAGVFIYTDRPFRIGDWIEWDGGAYAGIVEDITFRDTRVRTFDNELLTVPNTILTEGTIKNPVAKDELRIRCTFGIGYDDDIEQATNIIIEEAQNHPKILDDPVPAVRVSPESALADSFVGLLALVWIANPNRANFLKVRGEYITNVKQHFDEAGIDIPYPQVDLSSNIDAPEQTVQSDQRA